MEFDILLYKENISTVKAEAGEITSIKRNQIEKNGFRRFENGKVFQTSRVGKADIDQLVMESRRWGGEGINSETDFAPKHSEHREGPIVSSEKVEEFEMNLKLLTSKFPGFIFGGLCKFGTHSVSLKASYGLDLSSQSGLFDWYYTYQRKGSGNMIDGFIGEMSTNSSITKAVEEHMEFLKVQGRTVSLKNSSMPVILVEEKAPLAKFLESTQINKYHNGSLFSGKMNQDLFSKKISLVDKSYSPQHGNLGFFDGEGVVRKNDLSLIEDGKFSSLISDLRFSKKYNSQSSGNGLRPYNKGVSIGHRALEFKPGQVSWRKIVNNLDRCLIALYSGGGDSNSSGEYSAPVQIGYVMERGVLIGQAPQLTIKTKIEDYLKNKLIDISSDGFSPNSPSVCLVSEMEVYLN